jgi:uncharacterized protein YndB with AHSA1/START domain
MVGSAGIHKHNSRNGCAAWRRFGRARCTGDGTDYLNHCVFKEAVKPERIVYQLTGGRKEDRDLQAEVSWIVEAQSKKTKLTLHMFFPTAEARDCSATAYKAIEGGNETLGRLSEHLADGIACRR